MAPQIAAFPTAEETVGQHDETATLLDRAADFIRSWTARDVPLTMAQVLDLWRLAERELEATTPGSEAWVEASEHFIAARSEHRRLFEVAAVKSESLRRLG